MGYQKFMQIEEQIQKLLRLKAKIDLYRKLTASVQAELASINQDDEHKVLETSHPGLLKEFCQELEAFSGQRVEELGNPTPTASPTVSVTASPAPNQAPQNADHPLPPPDDEEPHDPLRFLKKYKHLDGKRVVVNSRNGKVGAVVRGMVTPYLLVDTDTGHTVKVSPKDVTQE